MVCNPLRTLQEWLGGGRRRCESCASDLHSPGTASPRHVFNCLNALGGHKGTRQPPRGDARLAFGGREEVFVKIDGHPFAGSMEAEGCSGSVVWLPRRNCRPGHYQQHLAVTTEGGFCWLAQRMFRFAAGLNLPSPGPQSLTSYPFGIGSKASVYRPPWRKSVGNGKLSLCEAFLDTGSPASYESVPVGSRWRRHPTGVLEVWRS